MLLINGGLSTIFSNRKTLTPTRGMTLMLSHPVDMASV